MHRLLLVEDDAEIAEPLSRALRRDGYEVDVVTTGKDALAECRQQFYSLVILDLGLPDVDGLEVCQDLRRDDPQLPILIVTARADEIDVVVGLDAGADDYITKPFRLAELLARVRANLRRLEPAAAIGGVVVDRAARRAFCDGAELSLAPKEFDLLSLLVGEAGAVVSRDRLLREVWDEHYYGSSRTLDQHISWLRRKLGDDAAAPKRIVTVRGVGFRFERP